MGTGYQMFAKLHPVGGLYRYKGDVNHNNPAAIGGWQLGKVYLLIKWERPEGISTKSPLLNAFFLVGGQERCVDIGFFRYLEQVE
tara:strand:+ start:481 stop:735 length:255 start_codon:yes stop_codon:yes gene_type:complete